MMADIQFSNKPSSTRPMKDNVIDEAKEIHFDFLDDDDDEILIQADDGSFSEQVEKKENETGVDLEGVNFDEEIEDEDMANISVGIISKDFKSTADDPGGSGFDFSTGKLWIYPTNYPIRDYQYNIVQKALYKNTMVVLPTGLGKTFIAAVVMYNFFRWFSQGKIVFMAPTKPLVAQQIQACYHIMGIPKADTVEMTGTMAPAVRQRAWREKRVVFLTPQVMTNDLSRGSVTADSIKCLVLDEAHKALGNHAYCQVIRELVKFTRQFRVLALSATPGSDLKAVQQVMNNLLISHIELRSEESIDIRPYTHERKIDKIVVPLGEELSELKVKYIQIMNCTVHRLIKSRVLYNREATKLSKFLLLKARDEFRQNPPQNLQQVHYGNIEADFAMAISLYHGFELLQLHGLRSLHNYLTGIVVGEKGYGRTRSELLRNADFNDVMEVLRQKFMDSSVPGALAPAGDSKVVVGHPKMKRLEEIVVDHFRSFKKNGQETRVMIFSQYRDSVQEIATILNQHQPLIKVMPFIGQSSAGKSTKGYTQKEQLMVMRQFREGGYNTLVSTCVGEEGLDIGDVDLIVCFDAHKSPIRLVQRMGRTGRKRQGRIVMLVTEGKEEQIYNQSLYSKKSIHKAILNGAKSLHFYPDNPRMIPSSVSPQCHKMYITVASDNIKEAKTLRKSIAPAGDRSRKISSVFGKQVKGAVEDGYLTAAEFAEIREEFVKVSSTSKHLPRPKCITLSTCSQGPDNESDSNSSQLINFSEWMPWQNRLQATHIIGHSLRSTNLVQTAEFIELQQCLGEENNQYDIEMSRLLCERDSEDEPEQREVQSSIRSFLTNDISKTEKRNKNRPVSEDNMEKLKGRISKQSKAKIKPKTCKRENTTSESCEELILIGSDSSLDEQSKKGASFIDSMKPESAKLFTELGHHILHSQNQESVKQQCFEKTQLERSKRKCLDNRQKIKAPKSVKKKSHLNGKSQIRKIKTKRKSSILHLMELNSSNVPSTKEDDFETDFHQQKTNKDISKRFHAKELSENIDLDFHAAITDNRSSPSRSEYVILCANNISKSSNSNTQEKIFEFNVNSFPDTKNISHCDTKTVYIPKAPPISELKELFKRLKSGGEFVELDLEVLMENWNRSGGMYCSTSVCQGRSLLSEEKRPDLDLTQSKSSVRITALSEPELSVGNGTSSTLNCTPKKPCYKDKYLKESSVKVKVSIKKSMEPLKIASTATTETVKHDNSKSPLFRSLINKSSQNNNYPEQKISKQGNKDTAKTCTMVPAQSLTEGHDPKQISKQDLKLRGISVNNENLASPEKQVNNSKLSNSFITRWDEADNEIIASLKNKNSVLSHESFMTFTQAMECLQTSSEEAIATPKINSAKHKDPLGSSRCEAKAPLNYTKCSNSASLDNNLLQKPNLGTYNNQDNKLASDNLSYCNQNILSVTSSKIPAKMILSGFLNNSNEATFSETRQKAGCINTHLSISSGHSNLDLPDFDLGIDLDEDDIIPPTPTRNVSQESIFRFKLTNSKNFSQEVTTFSSSPTYHKTSETAPNRPFNKSGDSPPASFPSMDTGKFEPVVSNFNLTLSSDEDMDRVLEHALQVSCSETKNKQNKEETLSQVDLGTFPQKFEPEKSTDKKELLNSDKNICYFNEPLVDCKIDKASPLSLNLPSPFKKQRLEFDVYPNILKNDQKTAVGSWVTAVNSKEFSSKVPTELCEKQKPGKLTLGKRQPYCCNTACLDNKMNAFDEGVPSDQSPVRNSIMSFENSKNLNSFDYVKNVKSFDNAKNVSSKDGECNKNVSEGISMCSHSGNKTSSISSVDHISDSSSVSKRTRTTTPILQGSPHAGEKFVYAPEVKASTPICEKSNSDHIIKVGGSCSRRMEELTPIRADGNKYCKCDSVDSFVIRRRKRATGLDLSSDNDTSPETARKTGKGKKLTLRQSESTLAREVEKSTLDEVKLTSVLEDFEDDFNDFEDIRSVAANPPPDTKMKKLKVKKTKMGAEFIEHEAVLSGEDVSSDEREDGDDFYESSFIDNNSAMTQSTDMRAVYLKSIKSPLVSGQRGRYKLQYNSKRPIHMDVFSQTLLEDHGLSEYEEDSFCVGNEEDDIVYDEEESQPPKSKQKKVSKSKSAGHSRKEKKRIKIIINSSSDEEEAAHIQMTQEFSAHQVCKFGRRVLFSSSEDEKDEDKKYGNKNDHCRSLEKSFKNCSVEKCETSNRSILMKAINDKQTSEEKCDGNGNSRFERSKLKKALNGKQISEEKLDPCNTARFEQSRLMAVNGEQSSKEKCDASSADKFKRPNMMKAINCEQILEENMKVVPPGSNKVLKVCATAAKDVANFDLLDESDWLDDFDIPVEAELVASDKTCDNKNSFGSPQNEEKLETKVFNTESISFRAKSSLERIHNRSNEKDVHCNSVLINNGNLMQCGGNISDCSLSTPLKNFSADKQFSKNTKDFVKSFDDDGSSSNRKQSFDENNSTLQRGTSVSNQTSHIACPSRNTSSNVTDFSMPNSLVLGMNLNKPFLFMTKEERLNKQKEKQEMYRNKLKQTQQIKESTRPPEETVDSHCNVNSLVISCDSVSKTGIIDSSTSPIFTKIMETKRSGQQLQILVDSREISGAQEIISALRLKHCISVTARQLSCCDYILSNHLAADRIQWSTFSNSSHRSKLSSRLSEMQALYDRCVLIVETDRLKRGQEKSRKPVHRTKYLDTTLCYLAETKVKVYFTDCVEETATLLADLCHIEQIKGRALNVPTILNSGKEEVFNFMLSLPKMTVPQALNLTHKFHSIDELLSSPATIIQERGSMTPEAAEALHKFLHHRFDIHKISKAKS